MAQATSNLLIGVATTDITPPVGVTLVGYNPRTSDSLAHPLRAEALVVKDVSGAAWAMVTSDVIGYQRDYVEQVRSRIASRTALRPEAVLVAGTHTHSGPATVNFGSQSLSDVDAAYLDRLQERLVDVVVSADAAAKPGDFEVAWTKAADLGSNRRIQQADGKWANEWQDPEGRHPGYFDPDVLLVAVRRPSGELDALLVNYGCHPVVLGPQSLAISADYPGYLKDTLEATGKVGTAMFALAGGANINPRQCILVGAEHPKAMGEQLARIVLHALGKLSPVASAVPRSHQQPWNIVRTREAAKRKDRPNTAVGDTVPTEVQAFRVGDLAVVSMPGELFSEYNRMLRRASPAPQTIVVSLANDYIGYLPTDEAQAQGAYETNMAPAVGLEKMLLDTAESALGGIA